jgi:hypothetical protein
MQDDQIGPKIVVLAPADMARISPSIIIKEISSKQPSMSAETTPTLNLTCFTFLLDILLVVLRFLWLSPRRGQSAPDSLHFVVQRKVRRHKRYLHEIFGGSF